MIDKGPELEQDPTGRTEVPRAIKNAFKPVPDIKASTGLPEGTIEVPPEEGVFTRARRAFSRVLDRIDTNKENKPPLGKAF